MNHPTEKIEIIIMGGNFLEFTKSYQDNFIKGIYNALNSSISKTLELAKSKNQKARHRCVALCIETRPDTCTTRDIKKMLNWGCTRVELGVQCLDDKIYKKVNRGHTIRDVIDATKRLKDSGFKIGYHMMLGLPDSNPKKDISMFKKLFNNENFKPDQLKIYPCQVIKGAKLENLYKKKKYKPYSQKQLEGLLTKIMQIIPNYCRVMRVMREIPPDFLTAGIIRIDLRRDIEAVLKKSKTNIQEIRFRELGFFIRDKLPKQKINTNLKLKTTKYKASEGDEYFLEIINKNNILFALCRLRILNNREVALSKQKEVALRNLGSLECLGTAYIRELHVYGQALPIGKKSEFLGQHIGLGKQLIKESETICKKSNIKQLQIISGIGVREYFKKLGYKLDKNKIYMIKKLK